MPAALPIKRFHGRYAAEASSVGVMRGEVAAVAHDCGLRGEALADVCLVVSEAATNAVVHGAAGRPESRVAVNVDLTDTRMLVTVSDDGAGLSPKNDSPGLGLGLFTIAAITGHLDVTTSAAGTDVHMSFPVPSADAGAHAGAVHALEAALVEQDRMSERLDGAVGTSSELGAYARLQAAGLEVTALQAQVRRSSPTG